ncbi:MAG: leucine-rich repeat protein, partial [Clostridia bacterium]|nr:leucine-rich repeat protein [Clostridia bacterium]
MKETMKKFRLLIIIVAVLLTAALSVGVVFIVIQHNRTEKRNELLDELYVRVGEYDAKSIVLNNTSIYEAKKLAEKYDAKLRITNNGKYAALTLNGDKTIVDVLEDDACIPYIDRISADWAVSTCVLNGLDSTEDSNSFIPDIPEDIYNPYERTYRTPSRPVFDVTDDGYTNQRYLDYMNLKNVWGMTCGGGITVAVIDTGIDTDHPEFAGRISEYSYNASSDKIVKDYLLDENDPTSYDWSLIEDEQGHGTSVTGVLAAAMDGSGMVGIAPNVNIITIKAECDENGMFKRGSDLMFGLYYAIERDVNVVNMSFTTGDNIFKDALQLAVDSDIICVAAAGNYKTSAPYYPASDPNCIGVGALDSDSWLLADYSNYGDNSDIVAPGTTYTAKMGGGYSMNSGTSLASPAAAGVVALYLSVNNYVEYTDLLEVLYASCYDLGELGEDYLYGFGAIDASAMIIEEKGTITFDYLTDEIDNTKQVFIRDHTLQNIPEPDRLYAVFDGWYYDPQCTERYNLYRDEFSADLTLYAHWVNEDDGIPYTYVILDDGTIEIRSYTGHRRYITIPDFIEDKVVSSIGIGAFYNEKRLREINLPRYLVLIRETAFSCCSNLIKMDIPETVVYIGSAAFQNNPRFIEVKFSENAQLLTIGYFAFSNTILYDINLPASLQSVDGSAFYGCRRMQNISVKPGNAYFTSPDGVLHNYSQTTVVAYPAGRVGEYELLPSVRNLGACAFACSKFSEISLENVEVIDDACFACSQLIAVDIPNSVYSMGVQAFAFSEKLLDLKIGSGLNQINIQAFKDCYNLRPFTIPANITIIQGGAFTGAGMSTVYFTEDSKLIKIMGGAFALSGLVRIDIPKTTVFIDGEAFFHTPLHEINFVKDGDLQTIGGYAFAYSGVGNLVLPDNLRSVGEYAFLESDVCGDVVIPASLEEYGTGMFAACHVLENIYVDEDNKYYKDIDGVVYSKDEKTLIEYPAGNNRRIYTVKDGVDTVYDSAFYGSCELEYVDLPESLVYIQRYAFYDCEYLRIASIPENVMQISHYAYAKTFNLERVTFAENIKLPRLSYATFAESGISSITIPASVSTMAQRTFEDCVNLTSITFAQNSKLPSISAYLFDGCKNLEYITFEPGSALTSIQAHGLEGMRKLKSIDFGDAKITNIDNYAFRFCESLTSFDVPEGVTYLGRYAFYNCLSLESVTLPETLMYIGRFAFLSTKDCILYFSSETLPETLQEDWDHGIAGYILGTSEVVDDGDFRYARLKSGNIALLQYKGDAKTLDLNALNLGGDITVIGGKAFYFNGIENIVLPSTLTTIQSNAFYHTALKSVTISENVSFIGKNAFASTPVESVTFAENGKLSIIEQYAFADTVNLDSITLPNTLVQIGRGLLKNSGITELVFEEGFSVSELPKEMCLGSNLREITIPECVTVIWDNAFRENNDLKKVILPTSSDLMIRSNAFYHCGITELFIPANVSYIGEYAFTALKGLKEFRVDEDNEYYKAVDGLLVSKDGRKLIASPAGLTGTLTLPENIECLGFGAFEDSGICAIVFSKNTNIVTFGYRAFYNVENLTEITIPASVVSIDYYAFANCVNLHTVLFEQDNRLTGIYEGAFYGCKKLQNITLPETMVEISDFAFYGCELIDCIPMPDTEGLKGIYDYAFAYTGIKGEITMPVNLYDIGDHSFEGTALTKVSVVPSDYRTLKIGFGAFENCSEIEEMILPFIGSVYLDKEYTWFGYIFGAGSSSQNSLYVPEKLHKLTAGYTNDTGMSDIFNGITERFTELSVGPGSQAMGVYGDLSEFAYYGYKNEFDFLTGYYGDLARTAQTWTNIEKIKLPDTLIYIGGFSGALKLKEIEIPGSVMFMNSSCFSGCENLETVIINDGITEISDYAFNNCIKLETISIPDSVSNLGVYMLYYCTSLESVKLPNNIEVIPYAAFRSCWNLKDVLIPDTVTRIEDEAFQYCSNLETLIIPDGVTRIGRNSFEDCWNLKNIRLPSGITEIEAGMFRNCTCFADLVVPEGIISIGENAFGGCDALSVTLPSTLKKIGTNAFDCRNIYTVYNNSDLELEFGSENHGRVAFTAFTIYDKNGNEHTRNTSTSYDGNEIIRTPDNFVFEKYDGEYRLVSYYGTDDPVRLPEDLNGSEYRMFRMTGVKNVILPSFMEELYDWSFNDNVNLESVRLSESIKSISIVNFSGCNNLKAITVDENNPYLKEIDGILYNGDLTEMLMILPQYKGNPDMPDTVRKISAFSFRNGNVTEFTVPEGVTELNNNAFEGYGNLKKITLPDSLRRIGMLAFAGCVSLEEIVIPDDIEYIGMGAFSGCEQIKHIKIPEKINYIEALMFAECTSLESVELHDNVSGIGSRAFSGCVNLKNLRLPAMLSSVSEDSFRNCYKLKIEQGDNTFLTISGKLITRTSDGYIFAVLPGITGTVTIPAGMEIRAEMFADQTELQGVIISDGVSYIGRGAFRNCTSLKSIEIPDSVTNIEPEAFIGCKALETAILPSSMTEIPDAMFSECHSLKSIVIPDGCTRIGYYAFNECPSLQEVTIPSSVKYIESDAFRCGAFYFDGWSIGGYFGALGSVYYLGTLDEWCGIEFENEFSVPTGCSGFVNTAVYISGKLLENGALNSGTERINNFAFFKNKFIKTINIPSSVNFIGEQAFTGSGITSITIPDGVTSINFSDCVNLETAVLPDSIVDFSMRNCISLRNVTIPPLVTTITHECFIDCKSLESIIIPDTVTEVEAGVFSGCSSLSSVRLGSGLKYIGRNMFYRCELLEHIDFPDTIEYIDLYAFCGSGLCGIITIPESVKTIYSNAFAYCNIMTVVNNSDIDIVLGSYDNGEIALRADYVINKYGEKQIREMQFEDGHDYINTPDGFVFDVYNGEYTLVRYFGTESDVTLPLTIDGHDYKIYCLQGVINVTIPDGFTEICDRAFDSCGTLRSIVIPESVKRIGQRAFFGCISLREVYLPDGITEIEDSTFNQCRRLRTVRLPDSITKIGSDAFYECESLLNIGLNDNITEIGWGAFNGCKSLTSVYIPRYLTVIQPNTFANIPGLTEITIPDGVTELGGFNGCTGLKKVVIPDSVTSILDYAFENCTSLSEIVMGNNVKKIGEAAFTNTAYFNNPDNWHEGAIYLNDHLLRVASDVVYVKQVLDEKAAADAVAYSPKIKTLTISGDIRGWSLANLRNLEYLTILDLKDNYNTYYFGQEGTPITLKKLILGDGVTMRNDFIRSFRLDGFTIYVTRNEKDVRWDENYRNWSDGHKVYYGNEWSNVRFYDIDGNLISNEYYLNAQVIRRPYYKPFGDNYTDYEVSWDSDGDGITDSIPATTAVDMEISAVITPTQKKFSIIFTDDDGTVIERKMLPYGETITAPDLGDRTGYDFMGFDGYVEEMKVTADMKFKAVWRHKGNGHEYIHTHIEPDCRHEGYDEYVCEICGYSYRENVTPETEHSFGQWTVSKAPGCIEPGTEKRVCSVCGDEEYRTIHAAGHSFVPHVVSEPTCSHEGTTEYVCGKCKESYIEVTEKTPHHYIKVFKPLSFLLRLLEVDNLNDLLDFVCDIIWGRELNRCFLYECADCGKYMTKDEQSSALIHTMSASDTCRHTGVEIIFVAPDNCDDEGAELHTCKKCGKLVEMFKVDAKGHDYTYAGFEWTEDNNGEMTAKAEFVCSVCGDAMTLDAGVTKTEKDGKEIYTAETEYNGEKYSDVKEVYIDYTVKFIDYDDTVLSEETYHYGDSITVPANPYRVPDDEFTYTFSGWDKEITLCQGDAVYKATYTTAINVYTITFKNYDGTVIAVQALPYGDTVTPPSAPSRVADETYTYTFAGWTPALSKVIGNTVYYATYDAAYINYTVKFVEYNDSVLSEKTYHYGDTVQAPANPVRAADETYTYAFNGWDKDITLCNGNETYTATYKSTFIDYTIKFVDYDGRVINEKSYHYGDNVTVPANPEKAADNAYTYAFNGWNKDVKAVSSDETYTAVYTPTYIDYTVKFVNYDGTVLSEALYHYGDTVVIPADPTKPADNTYTYAFSDWDKPVTVVSGDTTYTATYSSTYIDYTVKFVDYDGKEILSAVYHYGDTVILPETPVRAADNTYTYTFENWSPAVTAVNGDATYTAVYKPTYIEYTIKFVNYDGTVLNENTYHYGEAVTLPAEPSKSADNTYTYSFDKWTPEVIAVNGDATYTATFEPTYIDYTVRFVDYDGTLLSEKTYHYGDTVQAPANPSRAADNTYTYVFKAWDKEISAVSSNETYTATYTPTFIEYTVKFVDYDDTVITSNTYHYGDTVTAPSNPYRAPDDEFTYTFAGWDKEITSCKGDETYKAKYTTAINVYTVTFKNHDGSIIAVQTYEYGYTVTPPSNPSRAADNTYTYTFAGWTPALSKVIGNTVYYATYDAAYINYTVKFVDYDGSVLSEKTYHYGDTVQAPANPGRDADETYTYSFNGWDKDITLCNGNEVYTATYKSTFIDYTIKFVDYDGRVIDEKSYHYGDNVTIPANPERSADNTYTYAFNGWDKPVTAVNGNTEYKATYKATYIEYTVTFVDFDGTKISEKNYHYGDTVTIPAKPTREADNTYTYAFNCWNKEIKTVSGNETYTATYTPTYIDYTVKFVDYNGTKISEKTYHYGDGVTVPASPNRAADNTYTYTFKEWDKPIITVSGNVTYTATYTPTYIDYTVEFVDYDGKEILSKTYHYGDNVTVPANPTRAADNTYTYTFKEWDKPVTAVNGDVTYTATYKETYIDYTVTFKNYDGSIIKTTAYHYGDDVTVPANPGRAADNTYTYTFKSWDKEITKVTGNAEYTATYDSAYIEYTVRFVDYDDTELSSNTYHYGDTVTAPANPTREKDGEYTYTFSGWDKDITACYGDETYRATYTTDENVYTVTFKNYDGSVIAVQTYLYNATVKTPSDPTRAADNTYTYTFDGWDKEVVNVTENAEYVATYKATYIDYTVKFVDYDGTVLSEKTYHYGNTVQVPENPAKPSDNTYTYSFNGWDKPITTVSGDTTYTAAYTPTYIDYTIKFVNYDNTVISEKTYHYGDTVTVPANPTKPSDNTYTYTFDGWDKPVTVVSGNETYTATYKSTYIDYTVKFVDYDGKEISVKTYHYGDTVTVPSDPTRTADNTYTYAFKEWDKPVTTVSENTTYTATYIPAFIEYTIKFVDYDDKEISSTTYHYGDSVTVPENPSRPADNTYTYTFKGWDKDIESVTGNETYKAEYRAAYIEYTVKFVDYNGDEISSLTYHYGDTVTIPENPNRPADNTYTYTFNGWTPAITKVNGNVTYEAVYKETYIDYTVTFKNYDGSVIKTTSYHYGDEVTVPAAPSRPSDSIYTYTFKSWDKEVTKVTGSTEYTATYDSAYIEYTVKFVDYDDTVLSEKTYHYGDTVTAPANPTREKDGEYTYTFSGWDKDIKACYGDETYRATYTTDENVYTVTFKNYDNSVISVKTYHYEDNVTIPEAPKKASDNMYYYVFTGWDKEVTKVVENTEYTAVFEAKAHEWNEPTYEWTSDYTKVTAKRVSKNDDSIIRTETVSTQKTTISAECEKDGKITYTASFTNEAFETQTYEETIQAAGHTYTFTGFEWIKTDNGYTVKAQYKCDKCEKTTSKEAAVTIKTIDPTCEEEGEITYTASIKAADSPDGKSHTEEKKETTEPKGHEWTYTGITFTETDNGYTAYANYKCDICEKTAKVNANVTITTTAASCEESGEITYTAKVEAKDSLDNSDHTDTKKVTVEQVGHTWTFDGFEWTKTDNGYTVSAKYICNKCNET